MKTQTKLPESSTAPCHNQLDAHRVEPACRLIDGKHWWGSGQRHTYEFKTVSAFDLGDDCEVELTVLDGLAKGTKCRGTVVGGTQQSVYISVSSDAVLEGATIKLKICRDAHTSQLLESLSPSDSGINMIELAFNPPLPLDIPSQKSRAFGASHEEHMQLILDQVKLNPVSFVCGVRNTSELQFGILAALQFRAAGLSVMLTGTATEPLDAIARRMFDAQEPPRMGRPASILRVGPTIGNFDDEQNLVLPLETLLHSDPREASRIEKAERRILRLVSSLAASSGWTEKNHQQELTHLVARRQENMERLIAQASRAAQTAGVVVANLSEVASNEHIHQRRFGVVIVMNAERATREQQMLAARLATEHVVFVGDHTQPLYSPGVFELSGVVRTLSRGEDDSRLFVLPTNNNLIPSVTHVLGQIAFGNQLDPFRTNSGSCPSAKRDVRIFDTSRFQSAKMPASASEYRFDPLPALLTAAATSDYDYTPDQCDPWTTTIYSRCEADRQLLIPLSGDARLFNDNPIILGRWRERSDKVFWNLSSAPTADAASPDEDMQSLTAGLTAGASGLTIVADIPALHRSLPAGTALLRYLDAFQAIGAEVEPYPDRFLTPAEDLNSRGLGFYLNADEAWTQIQRDAGAAQDHVLWNFPDPDAFNEAAHDGRLILRDPGFEQALVSPVDGGILRQMSGRGFRVITAEHGEASVFIDNDLFWLLGSVDAGRLVRPFVRLRGLRTPKVIAELFGLQNIFKHGPMP